MDAVRGGWRPDALCNWSWWEELIFNVLPLFSHVLLFYLPIADEEQAETLWYPVGYLSIGHVYLVCDQCNNAYCVGSTIMIESIFFFKSTTE